MNAHIVENVQFSCHMSFTVQSVLSVYLCTSGVTISTGAAICSSYQVRSQVVVAQTLCLSRNPKGSSHKVLNRGVMQATDKTSCPHEQPARSIDAEQRGSTNVRLDENTGEPHLAA